MFGRSIVVAITLIASLATFGCGAKQPVLTHAVYAGQIPIYPGAVLRSTMGSTSAGDDPESVSDGMAWFLDVKASPEAMLAFYQEKLPKATRDADWTDGIRLVWIPDGATQGERVEIILSNDAIQIGESVKPGKRAGNPNEFSQGLANDVVEATGSGGDD